MSSIGSSPAAVAAATVAGAIPHPVHQVCAGQAMPALVRPSDIDITLSPTYQLVQEMETGRDHTAVADQLYIVSNAPETGDCRETMSEERFPLQSQSFNALRASLLSHPRV